MKKQEQIAKGSLTRTITLFLVLVALGLGSYALWRMETRPRTDDAYISADTILVAPQVSGRIVAIHVQDNHPVKQGDVLLQIDPRPYKAALTRAEASLIALDREIELTQRTVNSQTLGASAAKANVEKARAVAQQAQDTLHRLTPLKGTQYASDEQLDQATTSAKSAQAQLDATILEAKKAEAGITGVEALVAQREVLKAEIELARLNVEYTTITAPFNGRVINLKTSVGQFAAAGNPIFTLANTSKWYVIANFRETELKGIRPGQSAEVYALSDPSRRYKATVESIGYGVFPDDGGSETAGLPHVPRSINWVRVAQRFPVRLHVATPDQELFRIGGSAVAILDRWHESEQQ